MQNFELLLEDAKIANLTDSEYLDGRYFNLLLKDFLGLLKYPLIFRIREVPEFKNKRGELRNAVVKRVPNAFNSSLISKGQDSKLARLILEVVDSDGDLVTRHSNLLIFIPGHKDKKFKGTAYRFEPLNEPDFYSDVNDALESYLSKINYDLQIVNFHPQDSDNDEDRGMCMAYVLKYAVMLLTGREKQFYHDSENIRRFAGAVEDTYDLPEGEPDVEYGAVAGAVAGGLAGLVLAGPAGAIVGGGAGAIIGSGL